MNRASAAVHVAVVGASFTGLLAAAALAGTGVPVTVLERDQLAADTTTRAGVPQGHMPHVLLHRGLQTIDALLPGTEAALVAAGGVRFNTGEMPWLGEWGWQPTAPTSFDIVSLSRPALEQIVRRQVTALPGVSLRDGLRVHGLRQANGRWAVELSDGSDVVADLVIDASGRSSRLPHWLARLGVDVPPPVTVTAELGYACRVYHGELPFDVGLAVAAIPATLTGALALPIEDGRWILAAAGYGRHRPGRGVEEFGAFLTGLRDPVVGELITRLQPEGEVRVYRQTANQRRAYGRKRDWPAGLLVMGDALCCFNPIYGQGITVAAMQAEVLRAESGCTTHVAASAAATRRLQRRLAHVAKLPWALATGEDLRLRPELGRRVLVQRLVDPWAQRVTQLSAAGNPACLRVLGRVYHLMGSPWEMISPDVVAAVLRSLVRGLPAPSPRPAVLAGLESGAGRLRQDLRSAPSEQSPARPR